MDAFEEGYAFFEKQAGVQFACHEAASMSIRLTQKLPNSSTI